MIIKMANLSQYDNNINELEYTFLFKVGTCCVFLCLKWVLIYYPVTFWFELDSLFLSI